MTDDATTPAGWYDDGTGRQRWFDGTAWGQYAEDVETSVSGTFESAEPVIVQRTRRAPFNPPPAERDAGSSGVMVSRGWGLSLRAANENKSSGLTRNRKIAGELPDWSPLPPGELSVDRTSGRHS